MSHYGEYIKEREGFEIVENDSGFATYKIFGDECYLRDIFVVSEKRQSHVGLEFLKKIEEIARAAKCRVVTGTVFPAAHGSTESLTAILKVGFKLHSCTGEKIVLMKEL